MLHLSPLPRGAVITRSELASVADGGTVVICMVVDLQENEEGATCWYNLLVDTEDGMKSVYEGEDFENTEGGWQKIAIDPATFPPGRDVYPCLAMCSSEYLNINFGRADWESEDIVPPDDFSSPFLGLMNPSMVRNSSFNPAAPLY